MATEPIQNRRWPTAGLSFTGAFLGMGLGQAHEIYHVLEGPSDHEALFLHILIRLIGLTFGGALLLGCIAGVRNRLILSGRARLADRYLSGH